MNCLRLVLDMEYNPRYKRSFSERAKSALWLFVNATFFRLSPFFMYGWRAFVLRCFGAKIGHSVRIKRTAVFKYPWNLYLDDEVLICDRAHVFCEDVVEIGRRAQIGESTWILTASHEVNSVSFSRVKRPVRVGPCVWIATNAMVLGRNVGEGAVVAAGAVVTKNVEPWTVVGGNPAKFIRKRELRDD